MTTEVMDEKKEQHFLVRRKVNYAKMRGLDAERKLVGAVLCG